jgi:hypothetical protein
MFMLHCKMLQRSKLSHRNIRGGFMLMVVVALACLASLLLIIPTALE